MCPRLADEILNKFQKRVEGFGRRLAIRAFRNAAVDKVVET